jgi:hypothetical protein
LLPSLSSMLVDVEDPSDVDVVDPGSSLVEVLAAIDVDVDEEEEERSASLVDVLGELVVGVVGSGVVGSGVVAPVVADESSTEVLVAPDELVEALALVTEVDAAAPSSAPAQATPTTASAATTDVATASILFNI